MNNKVTAEVARIRVPMLPVFRFVIKIFILESEKRHRVVKLFLLSDLADTLWNFKLVLEIGNDEATCNFVCLQRVEVPGRIFFRVKSIAPIEVLCEILASSFAEDELTAGVVLVPLPPINHVVLKYAELCTFLVRHIVVLFDGDFRNWDQRVQFVCAIC